jgi:hypothetical protein
MSTPSLPAFSGCICMQSSKKIVARHKTINNKYNSHIIYKMKQEEDGRDGTERPKTRGNKKYNITHLVGSKKREKFKVIALPRGFFT